MFISSLHIGSLWKLGWIWVYQSRIGNLTWELPDDRAYALVHSVCHWILIHNSWDFMSMFATKLLWFFSPNYHSSITFSSFIRFLPPNNLRILLLSHPSQAPSPLWEHWDLQKDLRSQRSGPEQMDLLGFLSAFHFKVFGVMPPIIYLHIYRERERKMYTFITISVWDMDQNHWNIKHWEKYIMKNSISTNLIEDSKFRAAAWIFHGWPSSRIPTQRCSSPNWKNKAFEDASKGWGLPIKKTESKLHALQKKRLGVTKLDQRVRMRKKRLSATIWYA